MKCPIITNYFPPWISLQKKTALVPHKCMFLWPWSFFAKAGLLSINSLSLHILCSKKNKSCNEKRSLWHWQIFCYCCCYDFLIFLLLFQWVFPCGSECLCSFCVFIKGGSGNWKESITCNHKSCCGMTCFCLYWRHCKKKEKLFSYTKEWGPYY